MKIERYPIVWVFRSHGQCLSGSYTMHGTTTVSSTSTKCKLSEFENRCRRREMYPCQHLYIRLCSGMGPKLVSVLAWTQDMCISGLHQQDCCWNALHKLLANNHMQEAWTCVMKLNADVRQTWPYRSVPEDTAFAKTTWLNPHVTTHSFRQLLTDCQPQARTPKLSGWGCINLYHISCLLSNALKVVTDLLAWVTHVTRFTNKQQCTHVTRCTNKQECTHEAD